MDKEIVYCLDEREVKLILRIIDYVLADVIACSGIKFEWYLLGKQLRTAYNNHCPVKPQ